MLVVSISNLEKDIPLSIFSGGHIFKDFDGQTWWLVNVTHFPLTDCFQFRM